MQVNATAKAYVYISAAWVELDDTGGASPLRMSWGMSGNSPLDRTADIGELTIALNNDSGQYTPGGPSALAGFKKGIPFKLVFTFEGEDYVRFRGVVNDIDIRPNVKDPKCYVTVVDWLDYAAKHPVVNPGVLTSQRGDQVITTAVALVETAPLATDYDTGIETFATAFDTTTSHTKVYNELSKVAFSELGYVYLKKDKTNGETLVFEAQDARPGSRTVDAIPVVAADSGFLQKEDADYLLLETGDRIILNQTTTTTLTSATISDFEAPYGDHVINRMTVFAYPRRLSASPEVLFQLDEEIVLGIGESFTLKGNWADPQGGLPINAQDWVTPVVTTDYTMYSATGGGGSDQSANLTITTWTPGTEGFTVVFTNNAAVKGFINKFSPRATGIYFYNPTEHVATHSASITEFETESETIHQKYQNTLDVGRIFVDSVVDEQNQPRMVLDSIIFTANKSAAAMMAFLYGDVGQLHYVDIDELGVAGNYYIQGVEVTMSGWIITVKWIVKNKLAIGYGLTPIAVEFRGGATADGIDYGYIPRIANTSSRSISVWVYLDAWEGTNNIGGIMCVADGNYGWRLYTDIQGVNSKLYFDQFFSSDGGFWETGNNPFTLSNWHHILIVYDRSSASNDPTFYIDGSSVSVTERVAPSGTLNSEAGISLTIGTVEVGAITGYSADGKIFDPRIYNTALTSADATTLYNSGTPSATVGPTTGLIFQPFTVRTEDTGSYVGVTLTDALKMRDAQFGVVNKGVFGAPVGRAAP